MTKKEVIEAVASQTGQNVSEVSRTIETFISTIKTNVTAGKPIYIRGFGTFGMKLRPARKARDIRKNKEMELPECRVPTFRMSKNFLG